MANAIIAKDYDFLETFTMRKFDGTLFSVQLAATVNAAVTSRDGNTIYITSTAQNNAETGADWTNGIVAVKFPLSATGVIESKPYRLEISVTQDTIKSYFQFPLRGVKGVL